MIEAEQITGVILCGGKGSRLNNRDKPLLELGSRRVIDWIVERLQPQVSRILLAGSRNVAIYEATGFEVIIDESPECGPLSGLVAAFEHVETEWVLTTPGDTPFLLSDLVTQMSETAIKHGGAVPVVGPYQQNLCLLLNKPMRVALGYFYEKNGRAVKHWLAEKPQFQVELQDCEKAFFDINTAADLARAQQIAIAS